MNPACLETAELQAKAFTVAVSCRKWRCIGTGSLQCRRGVAPSRIGTLNESSSRTSHKRGEAEPTCSRPEPTCSRPYKCITLCTSICIGNPLQPDQSAANARHSSSKTGHKLMLTADHRAVCHATRKRSRKRDVCSPSPDSPTTRMVMYLCTHWGLSRGTPAKALRTSIACCASFPSAAPDPFLAGRPLEVCFMTWLGAPSSPASDDIALCMREVCVSCGRLIEIW